MDQARKKAKEEINRLSEELKRHGRLYYTEGAPEISDSEYDRLLARLEQLEKLYPDLAPDDSPTRTVGSPVPDKLEKGRHAKVMLSLDSTGDESDVRRFDRNCRERAGEDIEYMCEPKLDGSSIELVYERGRFVKGLTRGDGVWGEDVTGNLRTIPSVPRWLKGRDVPEMLSVRGEVMMHIPDFQRLNKERLAEGRDAFANPRNVAAGSLRQLDPAVTAGRRLHVYCYRILAVSGPAPASQSEALKTLGELGFMVSPGTRLVKDIDQAIGYHHSLEAGRDDLDYEIDGVVIKVNSIACQEMLGERSTDPRWAIAYKFKPRKEVTRVRDIVVQVGRTGVLTPLALLDPVDVGGVTVSRATLHNMDQIEKLGIRIGDHVRVQRAGDVIPQVVQVIEDKRTGDERPFSMPSHCPGCGSSLVKEDVHYRCGGELGCSAQVKERIKHYASKGALDIAGLSDRTVELLYERGLIRNIADLYRLREEDLLGLDGFKKRKAANLVNAVRSSMTVSLDRFVHGLGIRNVGKHLSLVLAREFGSLEGLISASAEELMKLAEIGPETAQSIVSFFGEKRNMEEIERIRSRGLRITRPSEGGALTGKKFVLTGTLSSLSRSEARKMIEARGGEVSSSVGTGTDIVVAGEKAGSKLRKAKELDIRVVDEEEFRAMLGL